MTMRSAPSYIRWRGHRSWFRVFFWSHQLKVFERNAVTTCGSSVQRLDRQQRARTKSHSGVARHSLCTWTHVLCNACLSSPEIQVRGSCTLPHIPMHMHMWRRFNVSPVENYHAAVLLFGMHLYWATLAWQEWLAHSCPVADADVDLGCIWDLCAAHFFWFHVPFHLAAHTLDSEFPACLFYHDLVRYTCTQLRIVQQWIFIHHGRSLQFQTQFQTTSGQKTIPASQTWITWNNIRYYETSLGWGRYPAVALGQGGHPGWRGWCHLL